MKKLLPILFLFVAMKVSAFVPTNEFNFIDNETSYGSLQDTDPSFIWVPLYHHAYYAAMYPQWTNRMYALGGSGSSFTNDLLTHVESSWHIALNSFRLPGLSLQMANDNGGTGSNSVYTCLTLMTRCTNYSFNGTDYTNQGITFPHIQTVCLGGYWDGDNATTGLGFQRSQASDQFNLDYGNPVVDLLGKTHTSGLDSDPDWRPNTGGHPSPWAAFVTSSIFVHDTGYETNGVAKIIWNYSTTTSNLDHCSISGVYRSATLVIFTNVLWSRMGPPMDFPCTNTAAGYTVTNNATFARTKYTNLVAWFPQPVYMTNLPSGFWTLTEDGITVARMSSDDWATNGFDETWNTVGPIALQKAAILAAIRDQMGANYTNNIATHNAGSSGPFGPDMLNLGSQEFGSYGNPNFRRGTSHITAMATYMNSIRDNYDPRIWTAAQQTNHVYAFTLDGYIPSGQIQAAKIGKVIRY